MQLYTEITAGVRTACSNPIRLKKIQLINASLWAVAGWSGNGNVFTLSQHLERIIVSV